MTAFPSFSTIWNSWVQRFGRDFWPLVSISAVFSAISFGVLIIAIIAILAPLGLANMETANELEQLNFTAGSIMSVVFGVVILLIVFAIVSAWQQSALLLRLQSVQPLGHALRASGGMIGRIFSTTLLAGLITAGPMLLAMAVMFGATGWFTYSNPDAPVSVGVSLGVGFLLFFAAGAWAIWAGVHYTMAICHVVFHGSSGMTSLRASWSLTHPNWGRILVYPIPLSLLIGVTSSVLQYIPFIGQLAVFVIGTPASTAYQYELWLALQPQAATTETPTPTIAA